VAAPSPQRRCVHRPFDPSAELRAGFAQDRQRWRRRLLQNTITNLGKHNNGLGKATEEMRGEWQLGYPFLPQIRCCVAGRGADVRHYSGLGGHNSGLGKATEEMRGEWQLGYPFLPQIRCCVAGRGADVRHYSGLGGHNNGLGNRRIKSVAPGTSEKFVPSPALAAQVQVSQSDVVLVEGHEAQIHGGRNCYEYHLC